MNKILTLLAIAVLVVSCGEKKEEKKEGGFEMNRAKKEEVKQETSSASDAMVDLNNKGVGPVTSVSLGDEVDAEMAARGEKTFTTICIACHQIEKKMIGPAMAGVLDRRSPEWVMNMILNPEGMLKEDPIAKALYTEYNNALMVNQGLSEDEARDVLEYLRTL